jgi:methionyl aminopeptidase
MYNKPKTEQEIKDIRFSGAILASVLRILEKSISPGMTTLQLDDIASKELKATGAIGPFLGHEGFPGVLCVSVNNEVVHGIPGKRVIESGDIVGLDFGVKYNGMITDGAITVPIGAVSNKVTTLLKATSDALYDGISVVRAGVRIGDISNVIQKRLKQDKLGIIEELAGHGVGHELHEEPLILNFGKSGSGPRLVAGMTIAIEPMATLGSKHIYIADDNWTILTADGSWGAQFEHTILVTEFGSEILTQ